MENKKTWKNVLYTAIICVLACSLIVGVSFVAGAANVGRDNEVSGSQWADLDQEVYVISNKADLLRWAKDPHGSEFEGKIIALGADITFNEGKSASSWASAAPAEKWVPVTSFRGVFDGRGHTISGLYYSSSADCVGMFANLDRGAVVRNLFVKNSYFKGNYHVGSVAGAACSATFANIYSNAIVETASSNAGGIVGSQNGDGSYKSNILATSCWFDGTIKCAATYASGIVGNQNHNNTVITDCLNTGSITVGGSHAAGISGAVYNGTLTANRCVNLGKCVDAVTRTVGGTAKAENSYLINCFAKTSAVTNLQPTDIRYNTVVEGSVIGLADSFTAADLQALAGSWKMNGSIPVPAYFAAENATEIPAASGEQVFTPTVAVKDVLAIGDSKVAVVLSLQGNKGISDMSLKLSYDSSVLTLVSVEDGAILNGAQKAVIANPVELIWDSDVNSAANGTLATLIFEVAEGFAADAESIVAVAYAEANNAAGDKVVLDTVDGKVIGFDSTAGDLNGDFVIDTKDATLLNQHLAGQSVEIILAAADTNGDGTVNQADADLLAKYLAGQNVTLG